MQAAGIAAESVTTNSSFTTTLYHYCPVHYLTRISILDSRPPAIVLPTASDVPGRGQLWLLRVQRNPEVLHFKRFLMHLSVPLLPSAFLATRRRPLSARRRQCGDPPNHASKQSPRQMALRQEQPIIASMFDKPPGHGGREVGFLSIDHGIANSVGPLSRPECSKEGHRFLPGPIISVGPAADCRCSNAGTKPLFLWPRPRGPQGTRTSARRNRTPYHKSVSPLSRRNGVLRPNGLAALLLQPGSRSSVPASSVTHVA